MKQTLITLAIIAAAPAAMAGTYSPKIDNQSVTKALVNPNHLSMLDMGALQIKLAHMNNEAATTADNIKIFNSQNHQFHETGAATYKIPSLAVPIEPKPTLQAQVPKLQTVAQKTPALAVPVTPAIKSLQGATPKLRPVVQKTPALAVPIEPTPTLQAQVPKLQTVAQKTPALAVPVEPTPTMQAQVPKLQTAAQKTPALAVPVEPTPTLQTQAPKLQTAAQKTPSLTTAPNTTSAEQKIESLARNTTAIREQSNTNRLAIDKNTADIKGLREDMNKMGDRINSVEAMNMATSNLFQPYNVGSVNVSVGVGGYENAHALAVGSGVRVNEHLAVRGSVAFEDATDSIGYGVGASYEW
ncbi:YadA-like family protein [Vibrio crassostreae]|uniref:YadA-like family protein n=1 Tax=Vibrio crassostreae TaxID=246167 RepID=UPI0040679996